jgi:hypothetical protein
VWIPSKTTTVVVVGELAVEAKSKIGGDKVVVRAESVKVLGGGQLFGTDLRVSALNVELDGKDSFITATGTGNAPAVQNGADSSDTVSGGGGGGKQCLIYVSSTQF